MATRGRGRPPDLARRREMARLRAEGLTMQEIGRRLGVTHQAVQQALAQPGPRPRSFHCAGCGVEVASPVIRRRYCGLLCRDCLRRRPDLPFGLVLRSLRVAAGLTTAQLAASVGLTTRTVRALERGHAARADTATRLLKALGAEELAGPRRPG